TMLLATGGWMLVPFGNAFTVNNLGISFADTKWVYFITGVVTLFAGPLLGKVADVIGKYKLFVIGTLAGGASVAYYCRLGRTPFLTLVVISSVLFVAITSRMISAQALISAVPDMPDRGAFMSINSAMQQFSGALASLAAGLIVVRAPDGRLLRYDVL